MTQARKNIDFNKKFEAKLSWKRKEALRMAYSISNFIDDNFGIQLPFSKNEYKRFLGLAEIDDSLENYLVIDENFRELVNMYYSLTGASNKSISAFFEHDGKIATRPVAHLYSRHRLDPVWNWRKSNLIRKKYKEFLDENRKYFHDFHPVHMVLTLPHKGGKYQGKEFYAKELIEQFNLMRKYGFWKDYVEAGEYGVEVKEGSTKANGLHIHIHALVFLKTAKVNQFRKEVLDFWKDKTGGHQIWVETIYTHKRDEKGHFIKELKHTGEVEEIDCGGGVFDYESKYIEVKKKFYVDAETRRIRQSDLTEEEKEIEIRDTYLNAILETIKYHFKNEALIDPDGTLNCTLANEVLENTKGKRLYSRFGKFYKESTLNFNNLHKDQDTPDPDVDVDFAKANKTVSDPFTGEEKSVEECVIVVYDPANRSFQPSSSCTPYEAIQHDKSIYDFYPPGTQLKKLIKALITGHYSTQVECTNNSFNNSN